MATTIPGGKYLGADGKTYHDANGKVIAVADAKPVATDLKSAPRDDADAKPAQTKK